MKKNIIYLLLLCTLSCFSKSNKDVKFTNCNNTFVVSDNQKIYLFEHDERKTDFHLLSSYNSHDFNTGAFLDCKRNAIISTYANRKDKDGVVFFDLKSGTKKIYKIKEGINMYIAKYKNGVLLDTKLLHKKEFKKENSYTPPGDIYDYDGKLWKIFTYTHFFDLDKRKIIKSYDTNIGYGVVKGDILTAQQRGAITKINLSSGRIKKIFSPHSYAREDKYRFWMPMFSLSVFSEPESDFYFITTKRSYNEASDRYNNELVDYEKNTVYKLENSSMKKLVNLPLFDLSTAVFLDGSLYIFTKKTKYVLQFDTKTSIFTQHTLPLLRPLKKNWYVDSVGYTKNNFIITVSKTIGNTGYNIGGVFLVSKDLKNISDMYDVPMGDMNVATNQNIQTLRLRCY